jgi:hypothetical protein
MATATATALPESACRMRHAPGGPAGLRAGSMLRIPGPPRAASAGVEPRGRFA